MTRKLDLSDFRSVRWVLEPQDFALSDDEPDPLPTDLIDEETWRGFMTLPDDVAIRTTSHQGSRIALLYTLWSNWIEISPGKGILQEGMLDAADDMDAALFNLTHGFYKQAISSLRNLLEVMVFACDCYVFDNQVKWSKWTMGNEEIRFNDISKKLGRRSSFLDIEEKAFEATGACILPSEKEERQGKSWIGDLYGRFCTFAHARGDGNNFSLWKSNGPIYSADGMRASYHGYLEASALVTLMAKQACPELVVGEDVGILFEPESILQYANEPFSELCKYYAAELF